MFAGYRTVRLGEVLFPGCDRRLFWGQGMSDASRDVRFIVGDWLWL